MEPKLAEDAVCRTRDTLAKRGNLPAPILSEVEHLLVAGPLPATPWGM